MPGKQAPGPATSPPVTSESAALKQQAEGAGRNLLVPVSLFGIFFLMVLYTLYLAAPILMPITLAVVMSLVLAPMVKHLVNWHVPRPLAAALVMLGLIGIFSGAIYALTDPATAWFEQMPMHLQQVEHNLQPHLHGVLHFFKHIYSQLTELLGQSHPAATASMPQRDPLSYMLFAGTPAILGGIGGVVVIFVLVFFLLASGSLPDRVLFLLSGSENRHRARRIIRALEHDVSIYLFTITLINIGLGLCVALMLYLFGLPNPLLWGGMVTLFNFVPYIGASVSLLVLTFVALLSFAHPLHALAVPAGFLCLALLEGQLVTPSLLGKRLDLSPVLVFVSVLVWGWMWGVVGMLLAVPLLASAKIVSERIECLRPFGRFLSH